MSGFAELARAAHLALEARPAVPLALATLVEVEGSSYRQPGARLLVDAESRVLAGAISGGCLEGDVAAHAAEVCATGRAIALRYDLRADLETIWGFGAACDGIAHLVLEPLTDPSLLARAAAARSARTGGALLTTPDGTVALPLSDSGLVSHSASTESRATMAFDLSRALRIADVARRTGRVQREVVDGVGYVVEPLLPVVALYLVGAGRGAEAFGVIARTLGWDVTVIDHREAMLETLALPAEVRRVCARAEDGVARISADRRTAVALLSHIFDVDASWLAALRDLPIGYIGVLGSRQRAARLRELVDADGATAGQRAPIHAPIGLDLGGESPESIALSAIAEIEAVMHGRPGGFLRERESPIHGRTPTPGVSPTSSPTA